MQPNEISVVITCYNLGDTIEEAVDSVLAQTRPSPEIIIVDDGSTDILTRQILTRMQHPRISIMRIGHSGVAVARNLGVAQSRSPYIVLLDADDMLAPDYLEKAGSRLDADKDLSFVSCYVQAFGGASYIWKPPPCTVIDALTHGTVHISSMFRRSLWNAVGGFDPELPAYEDLDFWLRAICLGLRGEILEEPLLFYRAREDSRYHRGIEPETYQAVMKAIIEKHGEVLNSNGTEVLLAKETFLLQLHDYQRMLIQQINSLGNDVNMLQREIENIRTVLVQKGKQNFRAEQFERNEPLSLPCWEQSVPGRYFEQFLMQRRWFIRGRIAIMCDSNSVLGGIRYPRWDAGSGNRTVERFGFNRIDRLLQQTFDCVIVLAFTFSDALESLLQEVLKVLLPGGSLLFATPGLSYQRFIDSPTGRFPSEHDLRNMLSRVLPLDCFETISSGNLTTLTAALHNLSGIHLSDDDFKHSDRRYPVLVAASALKPGRDKHPRIHRHRRSRPGSRVKGAIIIAYHRIASFQPDTHQLCVPVDCFHEHMRYLREKCTVMPVEEVFWAVRDGGLPPRTVAVTFDDGYLDAMTTAAPILKENGLSGTFFVNTDRLDSRHEMWHDVVEHIFLSQTVLPPLLEITLSGRVYRMEVTAPAQRLQALYALHGHFMTMPVLEREAVLDKLSHWAGVRPGTRDTHRMLMTEEVKMLSRMAGCSIGSHSVHHLLLADQPVEVQRAELRQARETIEALTEKPVLSFSYPFGAYSNELIEEVKMTPHLFGLTVSPGPVTEKTNPLLLPRYEIRALSGADFSIFIEQTFRSFEQINETD